MIATLDDARRFIASVSAGLDPSSRYISELNAVVDRSASLETLLGALAHDSRGARHAGAAVFASMTAEEKLRANLITNETVLFRFSEGEWNALAELLARFKGRAGRILCAPCSHGEEAFTLAAACLEAGVSVSICGRDIQPQCIASAKTGRLTMGLPDACLESPAVVAKAVRETIDFAVGDLLVPPHAPHGVGAGPWDLVVCRNFLGYFVEPLATQVALALARELGPEGALFVDSFCLHKFSGLAAALGAAGLQRVAASPVFTRA